MIKYNNLHTYTQFHKSRLSKTVLCLKKTQENGKFNTSSQQIVVFFIANDVLSSVLVFIT